MKKSVLLLVILSAVAMGCGRGPELQVDDGVRRDPMPSAEQIQAAKNGFLNCDQQNECNPAVALLSVATVEGLSRCSAFLIGPNLLMTNDHCIPHTPQLESDCSSSVFAHFHGDQHRGCRKILYRSNSSKPEFKDYAVIELDRPVFDRVPLKLSKRGFKDLEQAEIFKVRMVEKTETFEFGGVQEKKICHASHRTMLNVNVKSSLAPVMTFGDCPMQKGNSGAPVLNQNGEVGAVNQGYLSLKNDEVTVKLAPFLLDETFGDVSIGTQIRCVRDLVGSVASSCEVEQQFEALFPEEFLKAYGQFSPRTLPVTPFRSHWVEFTPPVKKDDYSKSFVTLPDCLTVKEAQSPSFSILSKIFSVRQGITRYLQAEWRPVALSERQTVFVPAKRVPNTGLPVEVEMVSKDAGKMKIPVCKK